MQPRPTIMHGAWRLKSRPNFHIRECEGNLQKESTKKMVRFWGKEQISDFNVLEDRYTTVKTTSATNQMQYQKLGSQEFGTKQHLPLIQFYIDFWNFVVYMKNFNQKSTWFVFKSMTIINMKLEWQIVWLRVVTC